MLADCSVGPRGTIELERSEARARASSLFISIDRGGWCGIADRLWREKEREREQEEGIDERGAGACTRERARSGP